MRRNGAKAIKPPGCCAPLARPGAGAFAGADAFPEPAGTAGLSAKAKVTEPKAKPRVTIEIFNFAFIHFFMILLIAHHSSDFDRNFQPSLQIDFPESPDEPVSSI